MTNHHTKTTDESTKSLHRPDFDSVKLMINLVASSRPVRSIVADTIHTASGFFCERCWVHSWFGFGTASRLGSSLHWGAIWFCFP